MKYILLLSIVGLAFISGHAGVGKDVDLVFDSVALEKKIVSVYDQLYKTNLENDRNGRSDQNIYVIDLDKFELAVPTESYVYAQTKSLTSPIALQINKRLIEFNASRTGIDTTTNKRRDGLVLYAILCPEMLLAYVKSNVLFLPTDHSQVGSDSDLAKFFDDKQANRILKYRATFSNFINRVTSSLKNKHPVTAVYSYGSMDYYTPDGLHGRTYILNNLEISGSVTADMPKSQADEIARIMSLEEKIKAKADIYSLNKKCSNDDECIALAVEKVIAAIKTVVDGDGSKPVVQKGNCKPDGTWPLKTNEYNALLEGFSKIDQPLGSNKEDFSVAADDAKLFEDIDQKVLPDKIFITEKLPELLQLMQGSQYTIQVRFLRTNVYIPTGERPKLAKDVFEKYQSPGNVILIVVPYNLCTSISGGGDDAGVTHEYTSGISLMPSAYTTDSGLLARFNVAFDNPSSFSLAFNAAFESIPKNHISYVGAYLWNGQLLFKSIVEDRVQGYHNLVDVYVMVDDRLEKLTPFLDCREIMDAVNRLPDDLPHGPLYTENDAPYVKCIAENGEQIRKILETAPKTFHQIVPSDSRITTPDKFNLRQADLLGEDGMALALSYVRAAVLNSQVKFSIGGNAGTIPLEDTFVDDNYFYGKLNPVHTDWIRPIVKTALFLADFMGPAGTFFEAGVAIYYYSIGDDEMGSTALESAALNIIMPFAMEGVLKGAKLVKNATKNTITNYSVLRKIEQQGIVDAVGGKKFWVRHAEKILDADVPDKGLNITKGMFRPDGALIAAGVGKETAVSMPVIVKKKVEDDLLDINALAVRSKGDAKGIGPYELRNDANDRDLLRRFKDALEREPTLTFTAFVGQVRTSTAVFNLSEAAEAALLKADNDWCDVVIDGVRNGKITHKGQELSPVELAAFMKNGRYMGKPVRIISLGESNIDELKAFADDLARELDTKVRSHAGEIKINEAGEIISASEGGQITWAINVDYKSVTNTSSMGEMLSSGVPRSNEQGVRLFTINPEVIQADGTVICRVNGKLTSYTPKQIADEMIARGLRGDEAIVIGLPEGKFIDSNYENVQVLAEKLNAETGNEVLRNEEKEVFLNREDWKWKNKPGPNSDTEYFKADRAPVGEKKITLLTKNNYKIADADGTLYVTVEGFTPEGKVIVYRPQLKKTDELTAEQFLKELEQVEVNANSGHPAAGRNIRIVPTNGAEINEGQVRQFLDDLAQRTKATVETPKSPIKVVENSPVPVTSVNWIAHHGVEDGVYFIMKKDNKILTRLFNDFSKEEDEAFINQLGLSLSEKNGTNFKQFADNYEKWSKDLADYYTKYGKVSVPTYINIQSIAGRLEMELPDALVKDLYTNPFFAQTFDTQLKYLDANEIKKIVDDPDLFNEVVQVIESETMKNGRSLPTFMAMKKLERLLSKEMIDALSDKFGSNELFFVFLSKEIDEKMAGSVLDKFKLYEQNIPEFLDDFKAQFLKRLENPNDPIDLPLYVLRFQEKNQMNLAGSGLIEVRQAADALLPQEGYFDIILKTDGKNFIVDNQTFTPSQIAQKIKQNPNWDERPVRFLVEGGQSDIKSPAQQILDELNVDGKINPKGQLDIKDGQLAGVWDKLAPSSASVPANGKLLYMAGTDQELMNVAKQLPVDQNSFTIIIEADADAFIQTQADGSKKLIRPVELAEQVRANPNYTEGTPVKIIMKAEPGAATQVQELLNHLDVTGQVYDGALKVEGGKLTDAWKSLKASYPDFIVIDNTDEVIQQISALAKRDPRYLDLWIHGEPNNFVVFFDGVKRTMNAKELSGRLLQDPTILKAIREGKTLRLVSCEAGAGPAALNLSKNIPELEMIASDVKLSVDQGGDFVGIGDGHWQEMKAGQVTGQGEVIPMMVDVITTADKLIPKGAGNLVEIWVPRYTGPVGTGTLTSDGVLHLKIDVGIGLNGAHVAVTADVEQAIRQEVIRRNGPNSIKGVVNVP
jgi:hypothetical protein